MPKGLLLVVFNFKNAAADEFHDWYDREHIPERQRVPGFRTIQRWIGVDDPYIAIATYDLDDIAVLDSAAYKAIAGDNLSPWSKRMSAQCQRLLRFEGEQTLPGEQPSPVQAGGFLVNAMNVNPVVEDEFNTWYDEEHIPALAAVPGVLSARRFRATQGNRKYLALYHLVVPTVVTSAEWKKAVDTPWTARMRPHMRDHLRVVSRAYQRGK